MAEADQRHAARLPHGIAGTVVGKADKDGNPTSFDPHAPPVVHVDPDEPDGGVIIDMSKVTREDMERAAASSEAPHEVYYNLTSSVEDEGEREPMKPLPAVKMADESTTPQPAPNHDQTEKMDQLAAGMSAMMTKLEQLESRAVQEEEEPQTQVEPEPVIAEDSLAVLEMPFILGGAPQKAKQVVYFDMGVLGNMMSRYHAVVDGHDCIVLVYDTRYEDGQQWIPPDRGEEPFWLQIENEKKKFLCSSVGLHFNIGVLDVTVLIKNPDTDDDSGLQGDE